MTLKNIKIVQAKLKELGLYKSRVDGKYGPKTRMAVAAFQRMFPQLVADGIYGTKTQREMFFSLADRKQPMKIIEDLKNKYPAESQCENFYGKVGHNQVKITLPYPMRLAWDERKSVRKISCHKKVADDMRGILEDTLIHYGRDNIRLLGLDMYGGCLNVRKIRGGNRWSTHAWGIAIDIDPANNQLRWGNSKARLARAEYDPFWDIVKKHGGYSLGKNKNYDWMHVQFCYR